MRTAAPLAGAALALSAPAAADQPRGVPASTVCSLSARVCATRGPSAVTVWRKGPGGARQDLWRAPSRGETFQVADDGRSLVEVQPWANLVDSDAGPETVIFFFHRPGARPVPVRLGDMIRNVAALPRTVSHRSWARSFGYDGRGHFQIDTAEGRRILLDPATGRPARG